jgi:hypothetical protein
VGRPSNQFVLRVYDRTPSLNARQHNKGPQALLNMGRGGHAEEPGVSVSYCCLASISHPAIGQEALQEEQATEASVRAVSDWVSCHLFAALCTRTRTTE